VEANRERRGRLARELGRLVGFKEMMCDQGEGKGRKRRAERIRDLVIGHLAEDGGCLCSLAKVYELLLAGEEVWVAVFDERQVRQVDTCKPREIRDLSALYTFCCSSKRKIRERKGRGRTEERHRRRV
jgi:hypothetical protein